MNNEDETIPITKMQLRAALLLGCASATVIFARADLKKGDEVFHRKLIEAEVEEIIQMMWDRIRD